MDLSDGENNDPFPAEESGGPGDQAGEDDGADVDDDASVNKKKKKKKKKKKRKTTKKPSAARLMLQRSKKTKLADDGEAADMKTKVENDEVAAYMNADQQSRCIPSPIAGTPTPVGDDTPKTQALVPAPADADTPGHGLSSLNEK